MNKEQVLNWLMSHARRKDRNYWEEVLDGYDQETIDEEIARLGEDEFLNTFLYDDDYEDDGSDPSFDLEAERFRRERLGKEWYDETYKEEPWFSQVV